MYIATIASVYPVGHQLNKSKYQTEYNLVYTDNMGASVPVANAILKSSFGSRDDYEDERLLVGSVVLCEFPGDNRSFCVIHAGIRNYTKSSSSTPAGQLEWIKRYNKIEMGINPAQAFFVKSDSGPNLTVATDKIHLDDSAGQSLTLDKNSKTVIIKGNKLNITIEGTANINVKGAVTLNAESTLTATVKGKVSLTTEADAEITAANLKATIKGNVDLKCKAAKVNAEGDVEVKAATIKLNGSMGNVLTTATDPIVDFLTGVPTIGVPTIKGG
jgi:hypothetical protein